MASGGRSDRLQGNRSYGSYGSDGADGADGRVLGWAARLLSGSAMRGARLAVGLGEWEVWGSWGE